MVILYLLFSQRCSNCSFWAQSDWLYRVKSNVEILKSLTSEMNLSSKEDCCGPFIEGTKCNTFLETKAPSLVLTFFSPAQKRRDILFNTRNLQLKNLKVIGNQGNQRQLAEGHRNSFKARWEEAGGRYCSTGWIPQPGELHWCRIGEVPAQATLADSSEKVHSYQQHGTKNTHLQLLEFCW